MSVATVTLVEYDYPVGQDMTQRRLYIYGALAVSADPDTYNVGGLPLSFGNLPDVNVSGGPNPIDFFAYSLAGSEYVYTGIATNQDVSGAISPWTLQISTLGAELTGAAIPAAVSSDKIEFCAVFIKG